MLGFDVAENGDLYFAYFGNRRVLKIDQAGSRTEIYHAQSPWSPTGVLVQEGTVCVLEVAYQDGLGHFGSRVRKQLPNGQFETLVTIGEE